MNFYKETKYKMAKPEVTMNAAGECYSILNVLGTTYCSIHKESNHILSKIRYFSCRVNMYMVISRSSNPGNKYTE
jgi:hypothetical protein